MDQGRNRRNRAALDAAADGFERAFTVAELHRAARARQPRLGLTTAYRAVERWRGQGLVEEAGEREGEALYVRCSASGHHHHLVCVDCGATTTLEECPLDPLRGAAAAAGFTLVDERMGALPARCASCGPA